MPFLFKSKQEQKSNYENASNQTTTPVENPAYQGLQQLLMGYFTNKMTNPTALPASYETGGIGNINNAYDLVKQSISNNLTSRGLGSSPIAGAALSRGELGRAGEVSRFQSSLPLVERQLQQEDLGNLLKFFFARPLGATTSGTTKGSSRDVMTRTPSIWDMILQGAGTVAGLV